MSLPVLPEGRFSGKILAGMGIGKDKTAREH